MSGGLFRPKAPKAKTQRAHAKWRALQRYGLDLSNQEMSEIIRAIQSRDIEQVELIQRQSLTRSVFRVVALERIFYVVYDRLRKQVATFLTPEMGEALRMVPK